MTCSKTRILNGWKEISEYLGCHQETAMLWYQEEGLPIAKVKGAMLTTTNAIEVWLHDRMPNRMPTMKSE